MTAQVFMLPGDLIGEDALLDTCHATLRTPWRPGNWDLLYDFLCDRWWLPPGDAMIRHENRSPVLPSRDAAVHASLLGNANRFRAENPEGYVEGKAIPARRGVRILPFV